MQEIEKYFKKSDLIPAIVQDTETGAVLMMAYMNGESLKLSLETGYTWFWSRSRGELWNKGGTSGNKQKIVEIYADCDDDTLLIKVVLEGEKKACHTGSYSCFFKKIEGGN
ncbi:MAG: phosphoribosyl-AMP cyclohydrolase [Ruminococcus sp.]|jgi:phosphoribosyl-AMP cyclohydrolase/phosphoribosyl-ATP pyrophosphohydrolase/phosphoribosyl-AMP cyclohydrolase|nr:phosphoribosyl-AMP cyclohydrolase [Ruminococcus sp.]